MYQIFGQRRILFSC